MSRGLPITLPASRAQLKSTIIDWGFTLFGLLAAQGLTAITLLVAARRLPPVEYGQYLSSSALVTLLVVLPAFGLDTWLLVQAGAESSRAAGLWQSALHLRTRLLLLWIVATILLALALPLDTYPHGVMLALVLGTACDSITTLSYSALRSTNQHRLVSATQLGASAVTLIVVLLLPLGEGRVALFSIGRAAVSSVVAIVAIKIVRNTVAGAIAPIPLRELARLASAYLLGDLAVATYLKSDLTVVSLTLGSAGASAYGPALNLVNLTFLVPNALYFVVLPSLSRAHEASQLSFSRYGRAQLLTQALAGTALSLAVFTLAQPIVNLTLGPGYDASISVLRLLSPIPFLKCLSFGLAAVLTAGKLQSRRTSVQVVCAIFNIVVNLLVVTRWGITGVAAVYTLSELLLLAGYSLMAHKGLLLNAQKNLEE